MGKQWNHSLNIFKLVASFFVVTIHCQFPGRVGQEIKYFAQFSVPFFFMISGYYTYSEDKEEIKNRCMKRSRSVLWMIIWANVIYLLYDIGRMCIQGQNMYHILKWLISLCDWKHISSCFVLNASYFSTHLWYLQALLYCYILCYFFAGKWDQSALYILGIVSLGLHFVYNFTDLYQVQMVRNVWLKGIPAFSVGMYLSKNSEKIKKFHMFSIIGIICVGEILLIGESRMVPYRILYLGNMMIAFGLFLLSEVIQIRRENIAAFAGRCLSGKIYVFHPIFIYIIFKIFDKLRCDESFLYLWMHPILTWMATVIFTYMIYCLEKRIAIKRKDKFYEGYHKEIRKSFK